MNDPIQSPMTKTYADRSTMEGFSFSFFCDLCGREWRSVQYELNQGNFAASLDTEVFQLLWNEQHNAAFERAVRDASFVFNRCPVCGRRVCKECYYLAETGVSDICKDCLRGLNQ